MKKINPEWQEIGQRISMWISERGWSKSRFAIEMGIYNQNVNKYLTGFLDPQRLFLRLAEHGCDLTWLRTGKPATTDTPVIFTPEQAKIVEFLQGLGITTMEDLRQMYRPDLTIEEFMQHYQIMKEKIRQEMSKDKE